jgi:hypothetical protein
MKRIKRGELNSSLTQLICTQILTLACRAYIAASRRSDRSLEARIESARRASEIHKKRTGRALRVTEEDVVNEEMYEEEDDDILTQQRRLQTYLALNTGTIFDGRLNSWMLSTMGTRAMMLNNGFGPMQHQPTPFFPYNPPQSAAPAQTQLHPTSPTSAQMYNPMNRQVQQQSQPGTPNSVQNVSQAGQGQQRHASMSSGPYRVAQDGQRMGNVHHQTSQPMSHPQSPALPSPVSPTQSGVKSMNQSPVENNHYGNMTQPQQSYGMQQTYSYPNSSSMFDPLGQLQGSTGLNLLSPSLPPEAQQMFGMNAWDPSNPSTQLYMNQNHGLPVPSGGLAYTYNPNLSSSNKYNQTGQPTMGMSQTLSQSPLQSSQSNTSDAQPKYASSPYDSTPTSDGAYNQQNYNFGFDMFGDSHSPGDCTQNIDEYSDLFDADGDA